MIKSFLSLRRKQIRLVGYVVSVILIFVVGVNIIGSLIVNKKFIQAKKIFQSEDLSLNLRLATFSLLKGLTLYGLDIRGNGEPIFSSQRIDIGFDLFSLLKAKISVKNIYIQQSRLALRDIAEILSSGKEILRKMDASVSFYETTYVKGHHCQLGDIAQLDVQGYLSLIKDKLLVSKGKISLKKIQLPVFANVDIFRGSSFYKPFDYVFEAETKGQDFVISRCEFSNSFLKFNGNGQIRRGTPQPQVDFVMNFMNIILDDFPAFNNEHMKAGGVLDSVFKVSGTPSDLKSLLNIKIANAQMSFFNALFFTKINGSALVTKDHLIGQNFSLRINDIPFKADFAFYKRRYPHLLLQLSALYKVFDRRGFLLAFSADLIDNELVGNIKSRLRYASRDTANSVDFDFTNFRLGYEKDVFIQAENLETSLLVEAAPGKSGGQIFSRDFSFRDLFGIIRRQEGGFVLEQLKGSCYQGTLDGRFDFLIQEDRLRLKGETHLRGVDLNEFFEKSKKTKNLLLGKLDGDLRFDNIPTDMFKGQLFITDGMVGEDPLLNAVSDFLGVPSLKKIAFQELSMFFRGGRGAYVSQVKLQSPEVSGVLDGRISSYDTMDGYLAVNVSTQLLKESKTFRKLLAYIRHDEPSVTFPFRISSYISSPRVLWLKNEFKDKIQNLLPERNKRSLQRQVNTLLEGVR